MQNQLSFTNIENIIPHVSIVIDRTGYEGWSVPRRTIMDQELVLIMDGNGSFTIEDICYPVQPGMLFYFYPNLIHSGNTALNPPMRFLAVHFSFSTAQYTGGGAWAFDAAPPLLCLQPITYLSAPYKVTEIFKQLHSTWKQKESGYQWKSNMFLQQLLFEILYQQAFPPQSHANVIRCEKVIEYIRDHYTENITIKQLCSLVDLSPGYLSEIFKKVSGKTPVEYIHQVRIDRSKELLLNTPLKIKDIARRTGFNDEFYFTRVFKKLEGCTPSQFSGRHIID